MGIFNLKKKKGFIDLTEKYNKNTEKQEDLQEDITNNQESSTDKSTPQENAFNFLGNLASSFGKSNESTEPATSYEEDSERKRKFTQRIREMTTQIEDLSNQIYHLQQRIELLERKLDVNRF